MKPYKNSKIKTSISSHINNYLKDNKIKRTHFGTSLGVTLTTVNRWLDGVCIPEIELFPKICEMLDITIYDFIGIENPNALTPDEKNLLTQYSSDISFRTLIDRYRSEEFFREIVNKLINLE